MGETIQASEWLSRPPASPFASEEVGGFSDPDHEPMVMDEHPLDDEDRLFLGW